MQTPHTPDAPRPEHDGFGPSPERGPDHHRGHGPDQHGHDDHGPDHGHPHDHQPQPEEDRDRRHRRGPGGRRSPGEGPMDRRGPGLRGFWGGPGEDDERRGPGLRRGRGSRAGRGDIRGAILMLLSESPMHGYQLIQEISNRSGGRWSPSPGAIYPALNLLEDEGLISITADSGRKLASLTEQGTAYVADNTDSLSSSWNEATGRAAHPARTLRTAMEAVAGALHQLGRTGTEDQVAQAGITLEKARRELYLILAGETVHPTGTDTDTTS